MPGHPRATFIIRQDSFYSVSKRSAIVSWDEHPVKFRLNDFATAGHIRSNQRFAARRSFYEDSRHSFTIVGRQRDQVGLIYARLHVFAVAEQLHLALVSPSVNHLLRNGTGIARVSVARYQEDGFGNLLADEVGGGHVFGNTLTPHDAGMR